MFGLQFLKPAASQPSIETGSAALGDIHVHYSVQRKARRRKIALFIEPSGRLRFIAPIRTRTSTIDRFLHSSSEWVLKKLSELQENPAPHFPTDFTEGSVFYFKGTPYSLSLAADKQPCRTEGKHLITPAPDNHISDIQKEHEIRLDLILWYKKQARQYLVERAQFWCRQMGLQFRNLKITSPTRQWGSCTEQNDIRLNWRVMMAPIEVIDYLIVHEIAHIQHKHHRKAFWDLVEQFIPDYKARQQLLKRMDAGAKL